MYWEHRFNPAEGFSEIHSKDYEKSKFKIGEHIILNRHHTPRELNGRIFEVTGVNFMDEWDGLPVFEYSLKGFPFLCYESELEKL